MRAAERLKVIDKVDDVCGEDLKQMAVYIYLKIHRVKISEINEMACDEINKIDTCLYTLICELMALQKIILRGEND